VNAQKKILNVNAQEKAYEFVREGILTLSFKPNTHLSAVSLAQTLGMSRTPIREALSRLDQEGLVYKGQSNGFYVRAIRLKEVIDTYRVREALEVEAALEALPLIDSQTLEKLGSLLKESKALIDSPDDAEFLVINRKFHKQIQDATKNDVFSLLMGPIHDRVRLIGAILIRKYAARKREVFNENQDIYLALVKKDPVALESAVRIHVRKAREHATKLLIEDSQQLVIGTD
jgi:DNA-binding GntR family transcriptional regulator